MYTLYQISNKINHKIYIGYTKESALQRFATHVRDMHKSDFKFARALRKYGPLNFEVLVLDTKDTLQEALQREIELIALHDSIKLGYNSNKGGRGGNTGAYDKVSKSLKKYLQKNKRPPKTKENIEKQKKSFQEFLLTPEGAEYREIRRQKALGGGPGKTKTADTRRKLSEARRGRPAWMKKWVVHHPNNVTEIVDNLPAFCTKHSLKPSCLRGTYHGQQRHHRGFRCELLH